MKVILLIIFSIIIGVYDIKSNDVVYGDIDKNELFAHELYNASKKYLLSRIVDDHPLKEKIINHTFTNSLSFYMHEYEKNERKQHKLEKNIEKLRCLLNKLENGPLETVIAKDNQEVGNKLQKKLQKNLNINLPDQESKAMTEADDLDFQRAAQEANADQALRFRLEKMTPDYIVRVVNTVKLVFIVINQGYDIEGIEKQRDSLRSMVNLLMNKLVTYDDLKNIYRL